MRKQSHPDPFLRVIAVFKLIKALVFFSAGITVLHFLNRDVEAWLQHLADSFHVDSDSHLARWCLEEAGKLTNLKLVSLSAICFFYATLFSIEGTGLYLQKRWAEYLVVIITASLLPLEAYEIWLKVNAIKILLTVANLMILSYLIYLIRRKQTE